MPRLVSRFLRIQSLLSHSSFFYFWISNYRGVNSTKQERPLIRGHIISDHPVCVQKPYYIGLLTQVFALCTAKIEGMWGRLQSAPLHNKIPGHYHLVRNLDAEEHGSHVIRSHIGLLYKNRIRDPYIHSSVP